APKTSAAPSSAAPVLLRISPPRSEFIEAKWWFEEVEGSLSPCRRFPVALSPAGRSELRGRTKERDLWTCGQGPPAGRALVLAPTQASPEEDPRPHATPYTHRQCPCRPVEPQRRLTRPGGPDPARRQRLRRGGLLDRGAAPAAPEGGLLAAAGDPRGGRDARARAGR